MKSISQIGKAGLSRIFKPEQKGDVQSGANYQFERTVKFFQDDGSLTIPHYDVEKTKTGQITLSTEFKVWSIELGIRNVNLSENEKNLYKAIYREYDLKPTHIIVIHRRKYADHYDHYAIENEDVCIYRVIMENTDCWDTSYEEAMQAHSDMIAGLTSTGNGSWAH
jgi:hypothetical protein